MHPRSPTGSLSDCQLTAEPQKQAHLNDSSEKTFLESLSHVFKKMRKDFIDTFKPYKSGNRYILKDFLLPLDHLLASLIALFNLVYAPCNLLFEIAATTFKAIRTRSFSTFKRETQFSLKDNISSFILSTLVLLRSGLAVAATPLIWFLRMPLRALLSLALGRPTIISSLKPKAEAVETLIKEQHNNSKQDPAIHEKMRAIKAKLDKSLGKWTTIGQKLEVTTAALNQTFSEYEEKYNNAQILRTSKIDSTFILKPSKETLQKGADAETFQSSLKFLSLFTKNKVPMMTEQDQAAVVAAAFASGRAPAPAPGN